MTILTKHGKRGRPRKTASKPKRCPVCAVYLEVFRAIADNYRVKARASRRMAESCDAMAGIIERMLAHEVTP